MSWLTNPIKSMARRISGAAPDAGASGSWFFRLPIAGVNVNERTALNYSAVFRCVKAITDPMLLMPFHVMQRQEGKRIIQADHPVDWVLHRQANPEMSASTCREVLQGHACTWGNGYAEIERNRSGKVIALWPLRPDRTEPKRADTGRLYYEHRQPNGTVIKLPPEDVFHLKGFGFDGLTGYSQIGLSRESISLGMATEQFGAAFFGNGAVLGTVITAPVGIELKESAVKNLKNTFNKQHQGASKAHRTEVLDQGMKAEMIGVPPEQAQFLETRKFQLAEVARWFGVPLHKLMSDTGMTFKNVEQLDIIFVTDTLMPWNKRWEDEANIKLLGRDEPGLYTKINVKGLLRGDIDTRKAWYKDMFGIGVYSINEIRDFEDEDPIGPEGDIRMVPLNMATLAEAYANGTTGKVITGLPASQQLAAGAPVYIDAVTRLARKESRAVAAMARKATDLEAFEGKASAFYMEHSAQLFEAVEPAMRAIAALSGQPVEIFESTIRAEVGDYCELSFASAVTAYGSETIERFAQALEFEARDRAIAFLEKQLINTRRAA
jgi:HK97 family phage portal protein